MRELTEDGTIRIEYVATSKNPSDMLTKVLEENKLAPLLKLVNLVNRECHKKGIYME